MPVETRLSERCLCPQGSHFKSIGATAAFYLWRGNRFEKSGSKRKQMKKSVLYRFLQGFFQRTPKPHRMISVLGPVLPSPMYGICNGYWMKLDLVDVIQRLMYLGQYEPVQSRWVREILKPWRHLCRRRRERRALHNACGKSGWGGRTSRGI